MIIRHRMPRLISRRRPIGLIGARSLQRSVAHTRRMLISRVPNQFVEGMDLSVEETLNLPEQDTPAPPAEPFSRAPLTPASPTVQRSTQPASRPAPQSNRPASTSSEPERMPADLQAIFNLHKSMGRVDSNPEARHDAETYLQTGGAVLPAKEPSGNPAGQSEAVQRSPVEDDFPKVVEPKPRRVRSKVEYVNRPDPDVVKRQQREQSVQRETEESEIDTIDGDDTYDFVNTFPPDDFDSVGEQDVIVQRDIERGTTPGQTPPHDSVGTDYGDASETFIQRDVERDVTPDQTAPPRSTGHQDAGTDYSDAPQTFIQRDIERDVTPDQTAPPRSTGHQDAGTDYSDAPQTYIQRDIERGVTPDQTAPPRDTAGHQDAGTNYSDAPQTYIQRDIERGTTPGQTPPRDSVGTDYRDASETFIQRDIERGTTPDQTAPPRSTGRQNIGTDYRDAPEAFIQRDVDPTATPDQPGRTIQRKTTISDPQPPTRIQRSTLPALDVTTDDLPPLTPPDAVYGDVQREVDAFDGSMAADTSSSKTLSNTGYDSAPDAGAGYLPGGWPVQRRGDEFDSSITDPAGSDEPLPVLMPPIGKLRHSRPLTQRSLPPREDSEPPMKAVSPDQLFRMAAETMTPADAMQREVDDTDMDDADIMELLDLPADTPIQRDGPPMPTMTSSVQREVTVDEVTSEVSSDAPPASGDEQDLDGMAQKVYDIIKRRLRIEQERFKGKK